MTLTTHAISLSHLEDELERLKDELAQRLMQNGAASAVSDIEARIERTWAAIEAHAEND